MPAYKNSELRLYIGIIAVSSILIAINILDIYGTPLKAFRYAFFQVSSIITTTGYATADFCQWPIFSQIILLILMFIGGCAGSTSGGLKVIRIGVMFKSMINEIKKSFSPRSVLTVKNDGRPLENEVVHGVAAYFAVYMIIMAISVVIVSIDNFDITTTITAVVTALNNVGPDWEMLDRRDFFGLFSIVQACAVV